MRILVSIDRNAQVTILNMEVISIDLVESKRKKYISRRTQGNPLPLPYVDFYIVATQGVRQTLCMSRELIQ